MGFYSFKVHGCLPIPLRRKRSKQLTFFYCSEIYKLKTYKTIGIMKKLLFTIVAMLLPMVASAYYGYSDGIDWWSHFEAPDATINGAKIGNIFETCKHLGKFFGVGGFGEKME